MNDKFEELAKEMMKYMKENHHPHCTCIITSNHCEILEGIKCIQEESEIITPEKVVT